ncbi:MULTISPECIES: DUF1002 domain-containing protein [unclassified Streptococcus]|uniref:DUF1002 domain-containing protein n=1 Tax=unclassified Streptococcus TaxID=2608887 RepID=UPI0015573ECF|nr:DUF1002 domain-containing protein [Streptococcus suis]NQL66930.1 DUF1002 domain-containing protein [Streptococcus suis]
MKKTVSKLALATLVIGLVGAPMAAAHADIQTDVINEKWGKPTMVYGGGLSDAQVTEVNRLLNIKNIENVSRQVVQGQDMDQYLGTSGADTASLFSSVLVQKQESGKGVVVDIKTPQNITLITSTQYANAAITAGATDVLIDVAAPIQVTGESALTGVYKALEANGETVDPERTVVAQQELETVNEVATAHAGQENFDSSAFDKAIAEIKTGLAEYKDSQGQIASEDQINTIINDVLKQNGLDTVITADEISKLVTFAKAYQETSAIDSEEVAAQLKQFKSQAEQQISDAYKNLQDSGILEKIGSFFEGLWKGLIGLFS